MMEVLSVILLFCVITLSYFVWCHFKLKQQIKEQKLYGWFPFHNPHPLLQIDSSGKVLFANVYSEEILSYWKCKVGESLPAEWTEIVYLTLKKQKGAEYTIKYKSQYYLLYFSPVKDEKLVCVYGLDITNRKRVEDELVNMSLYDPLTQLSNRTLFRDHFKLELAHAKINKNQLAVILLQLEGFQEINEAYGHEIGDQLLVAVANQLKDALSETTSLARIGDRKFGILLSGFNELMEIDRQVNALIQNCSKTYTIQNHQVLVKVSLGISLFPQDGHEMDPLIRCAKMAASRASHDLRNHYCFYEKGMNVSLEKRRQLILDLHNALEKEQFKLFYQPQQHIPSRQLMGAEVLIRWMHPNKGFISPGEFIEVAEDSGIIVPMGHWVLHQACKQIKDWCVQDNSALKISVNISGLQFDQEDLPHQIETILNRTQVSPEQLTLEITEGAFVKNIEKGIEVMHQIRALGVSLAIDDFGTGYSSLSYLHRFPVQYLKIDCSFIQGIHSIDLKNSIVPGIIDLAHCLDLKVIAEGVETQTQFDFLEKHQCDFIQGYLFGKPMAKDAFEQFFNPN